MSGVTLDFLALGEDVIRLHAEPKGSVDDHLQKLCETLGKRVASDANVIYFVLNHTRPSGRYLAAWLSTRCTAPPRVIESHNPPEHATVANRPDLCDAWRNNWSAYAAVTTNLGRQKLYTWNEFILTSADVPRAMGLLWNGVQANPPYYKHGDRDGMKALTEAMRACVNDDTLPNGAAATMAAKLKMFYGDWGGNAFLSIPVFTQRPSRGTVSVFSICTATPLTHAEITAWSYLAQCLLAPVTQLVFEEQRRSAKEEAYVESCPQTKSVWALARRVAGSPAPVLIEAATGTGKGLLAKYVTDTSPFGKRLIHVNCAAIPESLFESEMFGHKKGSFTGANADKKGKFEQAIGGTLFLDEVGETSALMQAKLLSALDGKEVTPVGAPGPVDISNVRIIAATNVNLMGAVAKNKFRADLYYRLACVHLRLPPLKERPAEHFRALVGHLIKRHVDRYGRTFEPPSDQDIEDLRQRGKDWPGNVRQLEQCVERALAMHEGTGVLRIDPPHADADTAEPTLDKSLVVFDDVAQRLLEWVNGIASTTHEPVYIRDLFWVIEWRLLQLAGGDRGKDPPARLSLSGLKGLLVGQKGAELGTTRWDDAKKNGPPALGRYISRS